MESHVRKLNVFTSSLLLATTPSMLLYPQDTLPNPMFQTHQSNHEEKQVESEYIFSYDDMLRMLDDIESGELEKKYTPEELENVKHFVAFLAKEGAVADQSEESLSLNDDIEELLDGEDNIYKDALSFVVPGEYQYIIIPAAGQGEVVLCKSWTQKQWKHVKKFAKKHKKALIIGAAVVVVTVVVVVAVVAASSAAAGAAVAGAAGAAGAASPSNNASDKRSSSSVPSDTLSGMTATHESYALKSAIDNQITSFKDNIVQNQFFQPTNPAIENQSLPWEENGRTLGSLVAHESYSNLLHQIPYNQELIREVQAINSKYDVPLSGDVTAGHLKIDRQFSTDYTYLYSNPGQKTDFNTLSYQLRGERASELGYYNQAVQDLGKAIGANPTNPILYLERGGAYFGLGQYNHFLEDYHQFASQAKKTYPLSVTDFSLGFAKGVPKGIYQSGKGVLLFLADFVTHPIHTSEQVIDSFTILANLVRNDEWGAFGEALVPEIRQLVTQWHTIPSDQRGELAGYSLGKYGADILVPGGLAKIARKGVRSTQELAAVCRNLQKAQRTLVIETAAGMGNATKIAEIVEGGQRTARLAEDLGYSGHQIGQLKQVGKLEAAVASNYEHLNLPMQESCKIFEEAAKKLKPYQGAYIPESQARELIHAAGIPTFARPKGIPESYRIKLSEKPGGIKYVHPTDEGTYIRIMPGKAHSPFPLQREPYVNHRIHGKSIDKHGNIVPNDSPGAHIPLHEFVYKSNQ